MAGDWIKFELSTLEKPEVWSISDALDIDPDAVVGKLVRVWGWFDQQTENGNAPSVTKKLLDRNAGVTGFCDAMISAGWMLEDETGITLPNFGRHNGKTAKNRALTAKRVAENRKNKASGNDKGNAASVSDALPREEKRREEKNTNNPSSPPKDDGGENLPTTGKQPEPIDYEVAEYILAGVRRLQPDFKQPNLKTWANDCRKMRELDGRTPRRIAEVFRWANLNDFWQTNILSPAKLRKQFDALEIKMNQPPPSGGPGGNRAPINHDDDSWYHELTGEHAVPAHDGDQAGLAGGIPGPGEPGHGETAMAAGYDRGGYPRLVGD